jgi:hypothetical protein
MARSIYLCDLLVGTNLDTVQPAESRRLVFLPERGESFPQLLGL